MTAPSGARSAPSLVTRGPFARFWWAAGVGSTGDWITIFATIAVADRIAGSGGVLAAIMSRVLPGLIFGPVVGVVTDRFDRRSLIVIADVGRGLLVGFLAFADTLPLLLGITFGLEVLALLGQSPRAAVLPRLVSGPDLVAANSLMLAAAYGTAPVGAAFNWVLVSLPNVTLGGLVPEANESFALAFMVDAGTFLVSGLLIATLPALKTKLAERDNGEGTGIDMAVHDLREGAVYMWRTRRVRRLIVAMTTALFGGGTVIVLGPPFVEEVLKAGATGFFAVVTTLGLGAVLGIAGVSAYSGRLLHRDVVFGVCTVASGAGLAAASMTNTVGGASSWMLFMGFGAGAAYVMGFTHLHESVGDEMRGRVFSTLFALMRIGIFVAMGLAVPLRAFFGRLDATWLFSQPTRTVLLLGGSVMIIAGMWILWTLRALLRQTGLGEGTAYVLEEASKARRSRIRSDGEEEGA
jgi:dTMP kinase